MAYDGPPQGPTAGLLRLEANPSAILGKPTSKRAEDTEKADDDHAFSAFTGAGLVGVAVAASAF